MAAPVMAEVHVRRDGSASTLDVPDGPAKLGACQARIVNFVNPKLTNFSNPYLLAVPIIILTLIGFLVTFLIAIKQCTVTDSGLILTTRGGHEEYARNTAKCIKAVGFPTVLQISGGWYAPYNDHLGNPVRFDDHVGLQACTPAVLDTLAVGYCPGEPAKSYPDGDFSKPCPGTPNDEGQLYAVAYQNEFCPTGFAALGTALAFTGYVEMLITFVIVGILLNCGVVHALNKDSTLFSTVAATKSLDSDKKQMAAMIAQLQSQVAANSAAIAGMKH